LGHEEDYHALSLGGSDMKAVLIHIAEALNYNKIDRLRSYCENVTWEVVNQVLTASISESYAILFFRGSVIQITPFGTKMSFTIAKEFADNYLLLFPNLDDKFLRRVFTGFELVIFKLCHICLENQKREYHWETEKTRQRLLRLKSVVKVDNWPDYMELFDEIFFVRDAFAHSFIDIEDIKYRKVRLRDCFGDSYLGRSMREGEAYGACIFMDDVKK
jgi:hypothetical protein